MTILLAAGEDTSGVPSGTAAVYTLGGFNDANFGRSTFICDNTTADPPTNRWVFPAFTSVSLLWFSAKIYMRTTSTNNSIGILFRSPDGVERIAVRQTATGNLLKISSRDAAGTFVDLTTASTTMTSALHKIDIRIDYTVSGGITWWLDGVAQTAFSGDPRTNAATQLNVVEIACLNDSSAPTHFSEVIVTDEDTRSMRLWTLVPQAAGNTQGFTPSTVGNINEATLSDSTFISTNSNNVLSQWTTPVTPPTGNWTVKSIVQEARVKISTVGPQHFDWSVRTASTDYLAGVSNAPSTSFGNFSNYQWATNPNTASAWV